MQLIQMPPPKRPPTPPEHSPGTQVLLMLLEQLCQAQINGAQAMHRLVQVLRQSGR